MNTTRTGNLIWRVLSLLVVTTSIFPAPAQTVQTNLAVTVRHAPCLNGGTVHGSLQQLTGESVTVSSGFAMTGDLLMPGTPTLVLKGKPAYSGTIAGNGSTLPSA